MLARVLEVERTVGGFRLEEMVHRGAWRIRGA